VLVFGHKIQGVFKHQKLSIKGVFHPAAPNSAGFTKSVPDFEICVPSLNYFDTLLYYFPSKQKFKEFTLLSSTFSKKCFSSRAFQAQPLKSKIKFQGFLRTSRSSTNPEKSTVGPLTL